MKKFSLKLTRKEGSKKWDPRKSLAIASYVFVFDLVAMAFAKKDKTVSFHSKQGFVQLVLWVLLPFVMLIPLIGWILGGLFFVAIIVAMASGIYNAASGKDRYVPFVGKTIEKLLS